MIFRTAKRLLLRSCRFGGAAFYPVSGAIALGITASTIVLALAPRASAAPIPKILPHSPANPNPTPLSPPAAIQPRGSLGYNSDDTGSAPFSHLDGFWPLWQTPGEDLSYVHSRLLLDNNGNLGGSLLLGYRHVSTSGDWVRGAYIGFDQRSTDHNTFGQLGFGLEQLSNVDLRFNAYLPIGNIRQASVTTGLQLRDLFFSEHQLNLVLEQQQIYEAATKGFDFTVGTQLARLGTGALQGDAAIYYYEPPRADGAFGYRLRLSANPQPELKLGLNFQSDPFFGSQFAFEIGTRWGGNEQAPTTDEPTPIWLRLADAVERTGTIAIDTQVEAAFSGTVAATNPETGDAWYFLHVNPGNGGDGQFATPYDTVEAALVAAAARSATENLNTTIYVQDTASSVISTAIPENVRLWSTGPQQQLNTREFGQVTLPLSSSGIYPLLTNTVQMNNGTHLAGFRIAPTTAGDDGIFANGVGNLTIRNNRISTTGSNAHGVTVLDGTGFLQITDNEIETLGDDSDGVQLLQLNAAALDQATITGNTITTQGEKSKSIDVFTSNAGSDITDLTVSNNQLSTVGDEASGVSAFATEDSTIAAITANQNQITTTGAQAPAIAVQVRDGAEIGTTELTGNDVATQGDQSNGIMAFAGGDATAGQGQLETVAIADNQISTQGSEASAALVFAANGGLVTEAQLTNNTIATDGADSAGILTFATGCDAVAPPCGGSNTASELGNTTIVGNQVETQNSGSDGILAFAVKTAKLANATIIDNTVTTQGNGGNTSVNTTGYSGGILAFASGGSSLDTASVSGNTVTTQGTDSNGVAVFSVSNGSYGGSSLNSASITNNTVTTTNDNSTAVMAFATNASSLMSAILSGNQLQTSGAQSYGISAFASNSPNFDTVQATSNTITTQGARAHGINLSANNGGTIATAVISGNSSTTQGSNAYGIALQANAGGSGGSTLDQVTVTNNTAQTTNAYADAMAVVVQGTGSQINQGTITSNQLQSQGTGAQGFSTLVSSGADIDQLDLSQNQITTSGDCVGGSGSITCADGINLLVLGGTVSGIAQIDSNTVTTSGAGAAGVVAAAIGSVAQIADLEVTGNTVTTTGARFSSGSYNASPLGVNLSAIAGADLTKIKVASNTITTQGEQAHGLQILATGGIITTATVEQNQIITSGSQAHGSFALANDNSSGEDGAITTASFERNTLDVTGSNANGLYTLASQGGQLDTITFVDNLINQATNSVLVQTSGSAASGLCVASFTGNESLSGATDLGVFQSAGNLRFLDFSVSNIQAVNTGFDTINFSNVAGVPTFDTSSTPCP
ncbi:MAG: hypothetical protein AAGG51_18005 [Cyanobacteria bacterium P01_G01_bin.54]